MIMSLRTEWKPVPDSSKNSANIETGKQNEFQNQFQISSRSKTNDKVKMIVHNNENYQWNRMIISKTDKPVPDAVPKNIVSLLIG